MAEFNIEDQSLEQESLQQEEPKQAKPKFDPNKSFTSVEEKKPVFDPAKEFTPIDEKKKAGAEPSTSLDTKSLYVNTLPPGIPKADRRYTQKEKDELDKALRADAERAIAKTKPTKYIDYTPSPEVLADQRKIVARDLNSALRVDKEQSGSRAGYIWNQFLKGVGSVSSAASDLTMQVLVNVLPEQALGGTKEEALKTWRQQVEPTIREATVEVAGADVGLGKQAKYEKEFWTNALGGVAQTVPMMIGTKGTGLLLGSYDMGLQMIENTEEGKKLPESHKSIFAASVGIANAALEKAGLDKIFGKQSNKVAMNLAMKTIDDLVTKTKGPITIEAFEGALGAGTRALKDRVIKSGGKIPEAAAVEFVTGGTQEIANIAAEKALNALENKQVFSNSDWASRIAEAAKAEGAGGLIFGAVGVPFSKTRNYIAEKVLDAKSDTDIESLKQEISQNIPPAQQQDAISLIDQYVAVNKKIPNTVQNKRGVAEAIIERDEIEDQIKAKEEEIKNIDVAFRSEAEEEINILKNKYEDLNNKAVEEAKKEPQEKIDLEDDVLEVGDIIKNKEGKSGRVVEIMPGKLIMADISNDKNRFEWTKDEVEGEIMPKQLKNIENTTKALTNVSTNEYKDIADKLGFDLSQGVEEKISIEYHKAKEEGTNPELVSSVENILFKPKEEIVKEEVVAEPLKDVESTAKALKKNSNALPSLRDALANVDRESVLIKGHRYTKDDIKYDILDKIGEDIDEIVDIRITGSRVYGTSKTNSDLDVIVEYKGDIREDTLFDIANDDPIIIDGVKVDVNPVKAEKSGTIAENAVRERKYFDKVADEKYLSRAYHKAKADGSNPELVKAVEDLLGKPKEEIVKAKEKPVIETIEQKEVIRQMLPITDKMVEIERDFKNQGYDISWDYDNETQILDKDGEMVDYEDLPDNLKDKAAQFEKVTQKLGDYDQGAYLRALEKSRGEEVEAVDVKPKAISEGEVKEKRFFHGGRLDSEGDIFLTPNENVAKEYASINKGEVESFVLDENKIIKEDEVREIINDLKIENKQGDTDFEDLLLHELLDPRMETSFSEKDIDKIKKEITKRGYNAISYIDEDITGKSKAGVESILVINKEALREIGAKPKEIVKEEVKAEIKLPKEAKEIYHYSNIEDLKDLESREGGTWFTENPYGYQMRKGAKSRIAKVIEPSNLKLIKEKDVLKLGNGDWKEGIKKAKEFGYDGVTEIVDGDKHYLIFDINKTKNRSEYEVKKEESKPIAPQEPKAIGTSVKEFITKNGRQKVKKVGSELVVTDTKTGKPVSKETQKKAISEYIETVDFSEGEYGETTSSDPYYMVSQTIQSSNNPLQLATIYAEQETLVSPLEDKEQMIVDYGFPRVSLESYRRFGDINKLSPKIRANYIAQKGQKGATLDTLAKSMSDYYEIEITPQDLIDFIEKYESRKDYYERKNPLALDAADRFKELTGISLNTDIAKRVIDQSVKRLSEKEQELLNKYYENEAQLEQDYWEAFTATDGFTKEAPTPKAEPTGKAEKTALDIAKEARKAAKEKLNAIRKGLGIMKDPKKEAEALYEYHKALVNEAKEYIKAGIKSVEQWAKEIGEKVNVALKTAWDEASGNIPEIKSAEELKYTADQIEGESKAEKGDYRGIRMKDNKERREELGMAPREPNPESFEQWDNEAQRLLENGYDMEALIKKMERGEATTPVENSIRKIYAATLDAELQKNPSAENQRLAMRFVKASDIASSQAGKQLVSLKSNAAPLSSFTDFVVAKMEANGVDQLTKEQLSQVTEQFEKIQAEKERYEKLYKQAQDEIAKIRAQKELNRVGGKIYKEGKRDFKAERAKLVDKLKDLYNKYIQSINKMGIASDGGAEGFAITVDMAKVIMEIVKNHTEEVGAKLSDVVKRTTDDLKDVFAGIKEQDVTDVIAGKYSNKREPLTQLQADLKDLRTEAKLLNELDRVMAGKPKNEKQEKQKNQRLFAIKTEIDKIKREKGLDQYSNEEKVKRLIESNKKREAQILEKIANKDFETERKPLSPYDDPEFKKSNPKLYKELIDSYNARQDAEHEFAIAVLKDAQEREGAGKKLLRFGEKIVNTTKKLVTGIDDSFLFMQTLVAAISRPKTGLKAMAYHIRDFASRKAYERSLAEIHNSEMYPLMQKAGLDISEPKSLTEQAREEAFAGDTFDFYVKIKGKEYKVLGTVLEPFERAATSLGNNMRALAFTKIAEKLMAEGYTFENNPKKFQDLAKMLNTETGRGKQNEMVERASKLVTAGIWSPRLMASRLNILGISDALAFLPGTKGYYRQLDPQIRKEALLNLAKFSGTILALSYALAYAFGGDIDLDPTSQTFLDVKIGNKSYNLAGGFAQYIRLIWQTYKGGKTIDGKFVEFKGNKDIGSNILHFMRGKLNPVAGTVADVFSGMKDYTGNPITVSSEIKRLGVPLSLQNVVTDVKRDGMSALFTGTLPSFVGIGVKDKRDFKIKVDLYSVDEEKKNSTLKFLTEKGIEVPRLGSKNTYKVKIDEEHPEGVMTDDEFEKLKNIVHDKLLDKIDKILNNTYTIKSYDEVEEEEIEIGEGVLGKDLPEEQLKDKISNAKSKVVKEAMEELEIKKPPKIKVESEEPEETEE